MRKRVWAGLLAALLIAVTPLSAAYADNRSVDVGLNVDVARRYYSPDSLKRMVDVVARSGGDYVQLHVCDDQNYGVESHLLGQTVKTARKDKNGAWVNPATGGRFLSKRQINELVVYAAYRNVELIPEVDLPGHATAVKRLAGDWGGRPNSGVVSASELVRRGFRVVNANGYYLYFVPSARSLTREALSYSMWDMDSHWDLGRTDLTREVRTDGVSGAMLSVWGEDSAGVPDGRIVGAVRGWFARLVVDARR